MDHAIEFLLARHPVQPLAVADVTHHQPVRGMRQVCDDIAPLDAWIVKIVEIVQDDYSLGPGGEQRVHYMAPDEAGATRDQKTPHLFWSLECHILPFLLPAVT